MATTDKIQLTAEKETLFIPLYGKALDYRAKHSILHDSTANKIVEKVGIDFTKYKRAGGRVVAVRAKQYDEWTNDFIVQHKNAIVIHLGCGLDARITRIQPPPSITWFDVDYSEVISLRKQFYPETDNYTMIASSILAPDWLEAIPNDRATFIIAEGVFEYLSEEEVKTLLLRLTTHFVHGQIAFDVTNSSGGEAGDRNLKESTGASIRWKVDDINEVDKLNSKLTRMEMVSLFKSVFVKQLPVRFRIIFGLLTLFPKYKNGMRLLRYEF